MNKVEVDGSYGWIRGCVVFEHAYSNRCNESNDGLVSDCILKLPWAARSGFSREVVSGLFDPANSHPAS
jgi:hypothetical protein